MNGANYSATVAIGATRFRPRRDPGGESACVELADILLRWFPTGIVRSETTRLNRSHGGHEDGSLQRMMTRMNAGGQTIGTKS